jgi:hypothetical protein
MTILSKQQWGGKAATATTPFARKVGVTLHWEGPTMNISDHDQCLNSVRGIQAQHMSGANSDKRPWNDIAYNLVACEHGFVFEGRGVNARSAANGTTEANAVWAAVCYLGGLGDEIPAQGWAALREAVAYLRSNGFGESLNGHRDHKSTSCPGDVIYGRIGSLMGEVSAAVAPPPMKVEISALAEEAETMNVFKFQNVQLDEHGQGWVTFAGDESRVISFVPQGPFPQVDGYWKIPTFSSQQRGANVVVTITDGPPTGTIQFRVVTSG